MRTRRQLWAKKSGPGMRTRRQESEKKAGSSENQKTAFVKNPSWYQELEDSLKSKKISIEN